MTLTGHAHRLHDALTGRWRQLPRRDRRAWFWALALFVGADMVLTALGLHLGAVEGNPVAAWLISAIGLWPAMAAAKAVVVAAVYAAWRITPAWERQMARVGWGPWGESDSLRHMYPMLLAWLGGVVACLNTYVVAVHAGLI